MGARIMQEHRRAGGRAEPRLARLPAAVGLPAKRCARLRTHPSPMLAMACDTELTHVSLNAQASPFVACALAFFPAPGVKGGRMENMTIPLQWFGDLCEPVRTTRYRGNKIALVSVRGFPHLGKFAMSVDQPVH